MRLWGIYLQHKGDWVLGAWTDHRCGEPAVVSSETVALGYARRVKGWRTTVAPVQIVGLDSGSVEAMRRGRLRIVPGGRR